MRHFAVTSFPSLNTYRRRFITLVKMSKQVLRRRSPIGAGLEADLAAVRKDPGHIEISKPSNDVSVRRLAQKQQGSDRISSTLWLPRAKASRSTPSPTPTPGSSATSSMQSSRLTRALHSSTSAWPTASPSIRARRAPVSLLTTSAGSHARGPPSRAGA